MLIFKNNCYYVLIIEIYIKLKPAENTTRIAWLNIKQSLCQKSSSLGRVRLLTILYTTDCSQWSKLFGIHSVASLKSNSVVFFNWVFFLLMLNELLWYQFFFFNSICNVTQGRNVTEMQMYQLKEITAQKS